MTYQLTSPDRMELRPYRSLPLKGFAIVIMLFFALITIPLAALVGTILLWGLLPFALMAIAALWWGLRRDGVYHAQPGWLRFALRLLVATLAMAALLVWLVPPTADWLVWGWQRKAWEMTLLVTGGMLIYLVVLGTRPAK